MATTSGDRVLPGTYLVHIPIGPIVLTGELTMPAHARGMILFAHGSGSSRHSPRNRFVARQIHRATPPFATLLIDLLTEAEESVDRRAGRLRFDVKMLARRLLAITDWLATKATPDLPIGYFGASTGAAAALIAAASRQGVISAVVSRGGRPDLAGSALSHVHAPTLLLVGGEDRFVVAVNETAQRSIRAQCRLDIIPGASHLFEEAGKLAEVADHALHWFEAHMTSPTDHHAPRHA
jgi:dienelactone hydrolase